MGPVSPNLTWLDEKDWASLLLSHSSMETDITQTPLGLLMRIGLDDEGTTNLRPKGFAARFRRIDIFIFAS